MQTLVYYLLGGLIVNLFHDWLTDTTEQEEIRLSFGQKIVVGLLWPLYICVFMFNVLKSFFNDRS